TQGRGAAAASEPADRPAGDLVLEADAAFARQDYARARTLYERAVAGGAASVHTLSRLALLQSWDGDLSEAIDNDRRALALAPADLDLSLDLARVLTWKNDLGEAIHIYEDLRARHPEEPRVLLGLGQALGWKGRYVEADDLYRDMEQRRIDPIAAHLGRAHVAAWKGDYDAAAHFYGDVLRADPGNFDGRLGLAELHHWQGLDRTARAQADNLVLDHPESREAQKLRQEIHESLRPHAGLDASRQSDNDSNRVDTAGAAYTFMAEPQTSIRIGYATYDAEFRCKTAGLCETLAGVPPVDRVVETRAQLLSAGVTSRLIAPLNFHARLGAAREETFRGGSRLLAVGGGFIRWQVGPRLAVAGTGSREALFDTAPLIDRGIHVDSADLSLEFRFRPAWILAGSAGYGSYSDGNARKSAGVSAEWRLPVANPSVTARLDLRYRSFNADKNDGYFDPLRYDSELLTVAVADSYRRGRIYWRVEGTYGRQDFNTAGGSSSGAGNNDRVQAAYASFGVGFGTRASLEAFYSRSDYALQVATGFTSTRSGFAFRMRF
ncbi:MAG TPA: tetratricopeptide repeat protein, partial [Candidatus Polarisedimenticolia bacterium]|nr:tetratricopeptide repeat protein [Candidatus Polarisedimenticolia bacterium]